MAPVLLLRSARSRNLRGARHGRESSGTEKVDIARSRNPTTTHAPARVLGLLPALLLMATALAARGGEHQVVPVVPVGGAALGQLALDGEELRLDAFKVIN